MYRGSHLELCINLAQFALKYQACFVLFQLRNHMADAILPFSFSAPAMKDVVKGRQESSKFLLTREGD
jgi:hypothetical protein